MIRVTIIICTLTFACTSSQHIRKNNYYEHDWSIVGMLDHKKLEPYQHHPLFSEEKLSKEGAPNYRESLHYFAWGSIPSKLHFKMSVLCKNEIFRQAYFKHTLGQAFISFITLGIYTPRTLEVWCG